MSDKKTKNNLINLIILIVSIVVIGIILSINSSKLVVRNSNSSAGVESANNTNQGGADIDTQSLLDNQPSKKLIYTNKSGAYTDIYAYNFNSHKSSKIFTDRDETEKIKNISSIANNAKILTLMSTPENDFTGNLYLINSDGSGKKEKIIENFSSPQPPLISPDGSKIAYLLFSNAETDFGFKLIISDLKGENKKQITSDNTSMMLYSWSPDSNWIIYSKGQESNLFKIAVDNLKEEKLLALKGFQIYSLSWTKTNEIVFSRSSQVNNSFNQADIFSLDLTNLKVDQLTENKIFDNDPLIDENSNLLYLSLDYNTTDNNGSNQIGKISIKSKDGTIQELASGNQIIGWGE